MILLESIFVWAFESLCAVIIFLLILAFISLVWIVLMWQVLKVLDWLLGKR
jgi:hypothetical protein